MSLPIDAQRFGSAADSASTGDSSVAGLRSVSLAARLKGGGLWVLVGRGLGITAAVLADVILARTLPLSDFGEYQLLRAIGTFATILGLAGWNTAIVRLLAERFALADVSGVRGVLRASLLSVGVASVLSGLGTFGFLHLLGASWLTHAGGNAIIALLAAWIFLSTWHQFLAEAMRGCHEQRFANLLSGELGGPIVNGLFCIALGVAAATSQLSLTLCLKVIVGIHVVLLPVSGLLFLITVRRCSRAAPAADEATPAHLPSVSELHAGLCLPLMLLGALSFLVARGDLWIAGVFCTADDLALYAAARRIVQLVALPLTLLNMAALPTIVEAVTQGRRAELERVLRWSATLASVPSLLSCLVLILFPASVLTLLLGPAYSSAAVIVICLTFGQAVFVLTGSAGYLLMMAGRQHLLLGINLATAMFFAIVGVLGAWSQGAIGLAIAASLALALQNLACLRAAHRILGIWTHPSWRDAVSLGRALVARSRLMFLLLISPSAFGRGELQDSTGAPGDPLASMRCAAAGAVPPSNGLAPCKAEQ